MNNLKMPIQMNVWVERQQEDPPRAASLGPRLMQSEPRGEVRAELVHLCDQAQETILLCSFLLAEREIEQALLRAARRGVRVYLLTASETRLEKELREDQDFDRKTMLEHKQLLDELAGRVLVRSAEHLHAKFLMTDVVQRPRGVLLTSNLTKEALARNWEMAVFLSPQTVTHLWHLFTWAFWEQAQKELLTPGTLTAVRARGELAVPNDLGALRVTAGDQRSLLKEVLMLIEGAQRSLLVSSFGFGYDQIMHALQARARSGVRLMVLTRPRPAIVDAVRTLSLAGATVYGVPNLHGKALCADGERGLVMTANLDNASMTHSFEVGVQQLSEDAVALGHALEGWAQMARWEFCPMADLRSLRGKRVLLGGKLRSDHAVDVDQYLSKQGEQPREQPPQGRPVAQPHQEPQQQPSRKGKRKGKR